MINIWTILLSLLIFGVLIAVHEAGHYISARLCKVGVTEFSIGMGPLILKKQGRNTLFTLRALPIGGYCKIVGETDEEDSQDSINSKSKLVRAFIFSAGSIMNLFTAYVFFAIAFVIVGIPTTTVGSFTQGYPAELSGMQTSDKILMIDDTKIDQWEDISLALADANATQSLSVQVYRESTDEYLTFKIKPAYVEDEERYILGVQAATTKNIFKALANAGALVWTYIKLILSTFIGLIRGLVGIDAFTGPIGVVKIVSDMTSYGATAVLQIAASISLSLGIINMLPIPALDGSRVFLLLVEAIKGSPIKKERENIFHFIGFALMILLAIVIAYNDIIRFF